MEIKIRYLMVRGNGEEKAKVLEVDVDTLTDPTPKPWEYLDKFIRIPPNFHTEIELGINGFWIRIY